MGKTRDSTDTRWKSDYMCLPSMFRQSQVNHTICNDWYDRMWHNWFLCIKGPVRVSCVSCVCYSNIVCMIDVMFCQSKFIHLYTQGCGIVINKNNFFLQCHITLVKYSSTILNAKCLNTTAFSSHMFLLNNEGYALVNYTGTYLHHVLFQLNQDN